MQQVGIDRRLLAPFIDHLLDDKDNKDFELKSFLKAAEAIENE